MDLARTACDVPPCSSRVAQRARGRSAAAFALSWDEVIVTIFTASLRRSIWIWTGLRTGGSGSEINVVAASVVVLSIIPVYFAQRLTSGAGGASSGSRAS